MEIYSQWTLFENSLPELFNISIPRKIIPCISMKSLQLHRFCDDSEVAYGACLYLRTTGTSSQITCSFIFYKSRVVPLKAVSIPRLELCGALLLAELTSKVIASLPVPVEPTFYWTDSTIVLGWLRQCSRDFATFVPNLIGEIQRLTIIHNWCHMPTESNPADVLSHGIRPHELGSTFIQWKGPA